MSLSITPTVSIIMATYNRATILEQTIGNIFEQDYYPLELIVINDGSTDGTLSALNHLEKKYSFILLNNLKNIGLQKSLNRGIKRATGKYIARIDDHDKWIMKNKLSKQIAFLEANTKVGLVGTGYKIGKQEIGNPLSDSDIRNQLLMRCPFCHVSIVMRTSIVKAVGGYDETLRYSEDWDLWLKIGKVAQLANLPDITVEVKEEDSSLSSNYFIKQLPINRQIVKQYFPHYPKNNSALLYHYSIYIFFIIIPINSLVHRFMKKIFKYSFLGTTQNKPSE